MHSRATIHTRAHAQNTEICPKFGPGKYEIPVQNTKKLKLSHGKKQQEKNKLKKKKTTFRININYSLVMS